MRMTTVSSGLTTTHSHLISDAVGEEPVAVLGRAHRDERNNAMPTTSAPAAPADVSRESAAGQIGRHANAPVAVLDRKTGALRVAALRSRLDGARTRL
jgi:hypothetical protein